MNISKNTHSIEIFTTLSYDDLCKEIDAAPSKYSIIAT